MDCSSLSARVCQAVQNLLYQLQSASKCHVEPSSRVCCLSDCSRLLWLEVRGVQRRRRSPQSHSSGNRSFCSPAGTKHYARTNSRPTPLLACVGFLRADEKTRLFCSLQPTSKPSQLWSQLREREGRAARTRRPSLRGMRNGRGKGREKKAQSRLTRNN